MIARGDMGVEVPYEELPSIQKELIGKCRLLGKRVITATEMLESMTHNIRPTRAEIADVANAVYDGTSAIMLSGETAAGEHPVEALSAMARIAEYTEAHINYAKRFPKTQFEIHDTLDAISHATCGMAIDIGDKAIEEFSAIIKDAKTVLWNGPMGVFEMDCFAKGTKEIAEALADSSAISIVGGGDSVTAAKKFKVQDKLSFCSTGGGASLELLEGKVLPGVGALSDKCCCKQK